MKRLARVLAAALLCSVTTTMFAAGALTVGPATRLSEFRIGAPGDDLAVRVEPSGNGFVAQWAHRDEMRSVTITGAPPKPDVTTSHKTSEATPDSCERVGGHRRERIRRLLRALDAQLRSRSEL